MHKVIFNLNLIHQVAKFGENAKKISEQNSKGNWLLFDLNSLWFS